MEPAGLSEGLRGGRRLRRLAVGQAWVPRPLEGICPSDTSWFTFGDPRTRAQLAFIDWAGTYPSPSQFIKFLFSCTAFQPHAVTNPNWSEFCDPRLDRQIQSALDAEDTNSSAAPQLWAQADRRLTDQAPLVPLVNPTQLDLVSRRVGDYENDPQYGVLIDQMWVRERQPRSLPTWKQESSPRPTTTAKSGERSSEAVCRSTSSDVPRWPRHRRPPHGEATSI